MHLVNERGRIDQRIGRTHQGMLSHILRMVKLTKTEIDEALPKVEKGLEQYLWIQSRIGDSANSEMDLEFQRKYNHFYRVRRSSDWQDVFYKLMNLARRERLEFPAVLDLLHQATGRYEASFASKLTATLNPSMPVIDSVVLKNLELRLPGTQSSDRAAQICELHNHLSSLFNTFLRTSEGKYLVSGFRRMYPGVNITDVKKLDLVLWQSRSFRATPNVRHSNRNVKTIYLVSCVSKKETSKRAAQDLYKSDWFTKAKQYVNSQKHTNDRWYILSAKHHLLEPKTKVSPYETTLNRMSKQHRAQWSNVVVKQLLRRLRQNDRIVVLAGARYREFLVPALGAFGYSITIPMERLGIGKQLAWLLRHSTDSGSKK